MAMASISGKTTQVRPNVTFSASNGATSSPKRYKRAMRMRKEVDALTRSSKTARGTQWTRLSWLLSPDGRDGGGNVPYDMAVSDKGFEGA